MQSQSQDIETATDLHYRDSSKQTSEPSTDTETAYKLMPPSSQGDNPSTLEINDPTAEKIPRNELSLSRGG